MKLIRFSAWAGVGLVLANHAVEIEASLRDSLTLAAVWILIGIAYVFKDTWEGMLE